MMGIPQRAHLSLFLLLLLAFIVRIIGINFGLPDLYHADEPIVVNHAVAYGTGDFHPHFFKIPPFVSYLLFLCFGIYFVLGKFVGAFQTPDDFASLFLSDPTAFYLIARIVFGSILGTLTVYALHRLISKFFSKQTATVSAFFLGFCFLHVRDSHYIYADIPLALILVLSFFPILNIASAKVLQLRDYLVFGVLLGFALAVKYNGIFIVVPFLAAHFFGNDKGKNIHHCIAAAALSLAIFFLLNPFSLIDFNFFLTELHGQAKAESFIGFAHHLVYSLNEGLGLPLLLFSVGGIAILFFRPDSKRLTLLSFVLAYYAVLCFMSQPYDRYVLPLLPFACFFAADALMMFREKLKLQAGLLAIAAALIVMPSAAKVILSDRIFMREDIRTTAQKWIEANIPNGARLALETPFFMPRLKVDVEELKQKENDIRSSPNPSLKQLKRLQLVIRDAEKDSRAHYRLVFLKKGGNLKGEFLFAKPSAPYDLKHLRSAVVQYVVLSFISKNDSDREFVSELERDAVLLAKFSPYKDKSRDWAIDHQTLTGGPFLLSELLARETNGEIIKIYRLK